MSIKENIELLQQEAIRASEMLNLVSLFNQYPEIPIYISRPGIKRALEIPLMERVNLMRFLYVSWESELNKSVYFLNKFQALERAEHNED